MCFLILARELESFHHSRINRDFTSAFQIDYKRRCEGLARSEATSIGIHYPAVWSEGDFTTCSIKRCNSSYGCAPTIRYLQPEKSARH